MFLTPKIWFILRFWKCVLFLYNFICYTAGNLYFLSDAQPTESEIETYAEVDAVLKKGQIILKEISQYRGASKEIREVSFDVSNPDTLILMFIK